jgi:pimeloyl-ACP methyl ester carboxylesterase
MRTGRANVGEIELAYDLFGERGKPLVLVMGIGAQRIFWSDGLCTQFARAGFHVCRFDNRDVGESTRLNDAPVPNAGRVMAARLLTGRPPRVPYTLADMATDTARLIPALGWSRAHVVGVSMGGMIVQQLAVDHPDRLLSMTSIMSANGSRRYIPEPRALKALFAPRPKTAVEAGVQLAAMFEILGGGGYPRMPGALERMGELAFERGMNPRGFLRHYAAIMGAPDRRPGLRVSAVPSLIIHGTRDPLFPVRAGRDLAEMMPDATWLPLAGMGHDMPEPLWPTLVAAIARHAERAESRDSGAGATRARF